MNPLAWAARLAAAAAHEAVAEYRRLDAPPAKPESAKTEINCTGANVRDDWTPHHRVPAAARAFGFGPHPTARPPVKIPQPGKDGR